MKSQTNTLLQKAINAAIPRSANTVSQWSDKYRRLSSTSAERGKWKTARAPYQREMMDVTNQYGIREIVYMTSAQVGKTEMLQNIFGYGVHIDPAPAMLVYPTLELAEQYSKNKLAPMIETTPVLSGLFNDPKTRDSNNTILHKKYVGGFVVIAGANSPIMLRSHSIKRLLMDEISSFPKECGAEGDPVLLAEERTNTFVDRLIVKCSTPTIKGECRIEAEYERSDKRRYYLPCLHCGELQTLKWAQIRFDKEYPDDARYECEACGFLIEHDEKEEMLDPANGAEWIAEKPFKGIAGFWINALYSPWLTWGDCVHKFLKCQNADGSFDKEKLKTFTNTVLAETFEEDNANPEFDTLEARREEYPAEVPGGVLVLCAGVDVQADRLECTVWGFGLDGEKWVINHFVKWGATDQITVWADLYEVLTREYHGEDGRVHKIDAAGIDTGGHNFDDVCKFLKANPARRWFALKGASTYGKPIVSKPSKIKRTGFTRLNLYSVGTDTAKDVIYAGLRHGPPKPVDGEEPPLTWPGYVHFPNDVPSINADYFKQLTAEKKVTKIVRGYSHKVYHKISGRRNEAIDCAVYAHAAEALLNPDYKEILRLRLQNNASRPPTQEVEVKAKVSTTDSDKLPARRFAVKQPSGFVHGYKKH
jgi:phage terminase large subunit GpA-like protein